MTREILFMVTAKPAEPVSLVKARCTGTMRAELTVLGLAPVSVQPSWIAFDHLLTYEEIQRVRNVLSR